MENICNVPFYCLGNTLTFSTCLTLEEVQIYAEKKCLGGNKSQGIAMCISCEFSSSFYSVFFFYSPVYFLEREGNVWSWVSEGDRENLEGDGGGETVIRI